MACTYAHLTGILALQEAELTFSYKRCARVLTLVAVSLLGLALLVRALVAFIEALAVLFLAVVVASLALPRGISWYWRQARREIPRLLRNLGDLLDSSASESKAAAENGMIRRLHHLRNGQSGFVVAIAAVGERAQRLRDMGLLPGVGIMVMGRSPMGDLLSLRVMGTTLALRVADAEDVTVSTDD